MTKIFIAGLLALVLSIAVATYSFAQTATPSPTTAPTGTMPTRAPSTGY